VIESFVEGRARLRSRILSDPDAAERVVAGLLKIDGVTKAEANTLTHGLLLEYDRERVPLSLIMKAAPALQRMGGLENIPKPELETELDRLLNELAEILGRKN
jgi:hypothetical protein